jgi:hypothetical protein
MAPVKIGPTRDQEDDLGLASDASITRYGHLNARGGCGTVPALASGLSAVPVRRH